MIRLLFALVLVLFPIVAYGTDYGAPDVSGYLDNLKQPDQPTLSCCGEGDAYFADNVEPCPSYEEFCSLVAIITDTRPNILQVADGTGGTKTILRSPVAVGTKVVVPTHKRRNPASENPTDHNIVFLNRGKHVICWEPRVDL